MLATIISYQLVETLTNETFSTTQNRFVKFYAPWCGHCKKLQPVFEELSEAYTGEIDFAEIDCVAFKDVCSDQTVESYPTIKLFYQQSETEYMGARTLKDMKKWLDIQTKQQFQFRTLRECEEENKDFDSYFVLFTPTLDNPELAHYKGEVDFCAIKSDKKQLVAVREGDKIIWDQIQKLDEFGTENLFEEEPEQQELLMKKQSAIQQQLKQKQIDMQKVRAQQAKLQKAQLEEDAKRRENMLKSNVALTAQSEQERLQNQIQKFNQERLQQKIQTKCQVKSSMFREDFNALQSQQSEYKRQKEESNYYKEMQKHLQKCAQIDSCEFWVILVVLDPTECRISLSF